MIQGDFTKLAKDYIFRPGYSINVLKMLKSHIGNGRPILVADVGAGTGKLTANLIELGLEGYVVEPNDAMREEGIKQLGHISQFQWFSGTAEETGLPDSSVDWVLMGSSFHWTDYKQALKEFHRILKPKGFFTAIWNPRDIERSEREQRIERKIKEIVPDLSRVSSGAKSYTLDLETKLLSTEYFEDLIFVEAPHEEIKPVESYLGAWRSVNDIQAQAGPERFERILNMIEHEIKGNVLVSVPYRSRSWTIRSTKR
jgi:ubiquinone/menaquinone biosynthesis C-methylase UbiE